MITSWCILQAIWGAMYAYAEIEIKDLRNPLPIWAPRRCFFWEIWGVQF